MGSPKPCEGNLVVRWVPDETQDCAIVAHKLALSYNMTALSMWYLPYRTLDKCTKINIVHCSERCTKMNTVKCLAKCTKFNMIHCFKIFTKINTVQCLEKSTKLNIVECLGKCTKLNIIRCLKNVQKSKLYTDQDHSMFKKM